MSENEHENHDDYDDEDIFGSEEEADGEEGETYHEEAPSVAEQHSKMGAITINGANLAYGLKWSAGDVFGSEVPPVKAAKQSAEESGDDLYVVPDREQSYWATGDSHEGIKAGMKPLGAVIAEGVVERPFLGVFEVELAEDLVNYYVIGLLKENVKKKNSFTIIPGTDAMFDDSDEALTRFEEIHELHFKDNNDLNDAQVVAPDYYSQYGYAVIQRDITDIVANGIKTNVKLHHASNKRLYLMAGVAVGAFALVALGIYGRNIYEAHQDELRAQAQQLARQRIQSQITQRIKDNVTNKTYPWDNQPIGVYSLSECDNLLRHIEFSAPGWAGQQAVCSPTSGTVTAVYKKTHGDPDWLERWMETKSTFPEKPRVVFDTSGNVGTVVWPAQGFFKHRYGRHEKTGQIKPEWSYLHGIFAHYNIPISLQISYSARPTPIQGAPDSLKIPVFDSMAIDVSTTLNPMDFVNIFSPVNKLVLNSLSISLANPSDKELGHKWSINMTSYQLRMETAVKSRNTMGFSH